MNTAAATRNPQQPLPPAGAQATSLPAARWWREPMVWLVISGPTAVIVAGVATMTLAVNKPDPLVAEDYYRKGLEINRQLAAGHAANGGKPAALQPAMQARNHAATPRQAGLPQ